MQQSFHQSIIAMWIFLVSFYQKLLFTRALAANLNILRHRFSFIPFVSKYKIWPVSVPLTWGGPEGAAVLFGPARWVETWVEVKEPDGCGCVGEALCAYQAQLQPPSDILLHLSSPGQPRVSAVLELHIAACAQELHWVSTALGLWGGVVNEKLVAHTLAQTQMNTRLGKAKNLYWERMCCMTKWQNWSTVTES